ncbi:MAG: hypothetical protein ACUVWX_05965 [Kiritimatiellia bacterium]
MGHARPPWLRRPSLRAGAADRVVHLPTQRPAAVLVGPALDVGLLVGYRPLLHVRRPPGVTHGGDLRQPATDYITGGVAKWRTVGENVRAGQVHA